MTEKLLEPTKFERGEKIKEEFKEFIMRDDYPCVMAQVVMKLEQAGFRTYDEFGSSETAEKLLKDLNEYIQNYDFESDNYFSFIAAFPDQQNYSELVFEKLLWKQLQYLHEKDHQPWDPAVSSDPDNENFSFSAAGKAFYVIGLHPNSSRKARRAPCTALVFNLHSQFEQLRDKDSFETVRDKIRKRDKEFQGSVNPMVEDFGENSEARQYSGRKVEDDWKCPFHTGKN